MLVGPSVAYKPTEAMSSGAHKDASAVDYTIVKKIGISPEKGIPIIEKHLDRLKQTLKSPGKGGTNFHKSLQRMTHNLWKGEAMASYDIEKIGKTLMALTTTMLYEERLPKVDYVKVAEIALADLNKEDRKSRKRRREQ